MEENTLALDLEAPHEYEEISKYSKVAARPETTVDERSKLEFSVTLCPAYVSTLKSTRQETPSACQGLEVVYGEVHVSSEGSVQGQRSVSHTVALEYTEINAPGQAQRSVPGVDAQYETMNYGEGAT